MIRLFFFVCLFAMCKVNGYDWSDSDFNLILQSDLEENLHYMENKYLSLHNRMTRQTQVVKNETAIDGCKPRNGTQRPMGHNRYQRSCCGDRDDMKMHGDALREIRRDCFVELKKLRGNRAEDTEPVDMFNCTKVSKTKDDLVCVMECVARKKNMLENNGDISPSKASAFVKTELVTQDWQRAIIDSVLEKCLKNNASSLNNATTPTNSSSVSTTTQAPPGNLTSIGKTDTVPVKNESNANKCNPASLEFSHCIWREMQLSCPKDLIRDTRLCQRMRERLQKRDPSNTSNTKHNRRNNKNKSDKSQEKN